MEFQQLTIERQAKYMPNEGLLVGKVRFKDARGEVTLILLEPLAKQILDLCAVGVVEASRAIAEDICAEVLTQTKMLEAA